MLLMRTGTTLVSVKSLSDTGAGLFCRLGVRDVSDGADGITFARATVSSIWQLRTFANAWWGTSVWQLHRDCVFGFSSRLDGT